MCEALRVEGLTLMIRATSSRSMDGWMDGWMDGVDLIICVAIWTLYKRCLPLISGDFRATCIASRNRLRSALLFGVIFVDFGGQNEAQNSIPEHFFSMLFSSAFLYRFLLDFWTPETLKIELSPRREHDFCEIAIFDKGWKNH